MNDKARRQFAGSKMMLPEHRESLQKHTDRLEWEEKHRLNPIDEQEQERLQQVLERAIMNKQNLNITIIADSGFHCFRGVPTCSNSTDGTITFDTGENRHRIIRAAEVVRLEL